MATTKIKSIDEYIDIFTKKNKAALDEQLRKIDANTAEQEAAIKKIYSGEVSEAEDGYYDLEQQNAVQAFINEKAVAEANANLGLTDSGLNRTQQTAVELSRSNNAAKIARAKREAVDKLNRQMAAEISAVKTKGSNAKAELSAKNTENVYNAAVSAHKADVEAYETELKKQAEAKQKAQTAESKKIKNDNQMRSDYTKLISDIESNNYGTATLLSKIYDYALKYNLELDQSSFLNSEISDFLKLAVIPESKWTEYFAGRSGKVTTEKKSNALPLADRIGLPVINLPRLSRTDGKFYRWK